jgi:hypothetical protein
MHGEQKVKFYKFYENLFGLSSADISAQIDERADRRTWRRK